MAIHVEAGGWRSLLHTITWDAYGAFYGAEQPFTVHGVVAAIYFYDRVTARRWRGACFFCDAAATDGELMVSLALPNLPGVLPTLVHVVVVHESCYLAVSAAEGW